MTSTLINLNGRRLAFDMQVHANAAAPVVVLEPGMLAESSEWQSVCKQTSAFASVIRYDRAGRGQSDPAPKPRTMQDLVNDLYLLLKAIPIQPPWLLVGQSIGGWIVRCLASAHPQDVAGLVLVDPTHECQFTKMSALLPPEAENESPSLQRFRSFWSEGYKHPEQNHEGINFPSSIAAMSDYSLPLNLPVTVLTSGTNLNEMDAPLELRKSLHKTWLDLHNSLLPLAPLGKHIILPDSGHFIQRDDPSAIVSAIREMLAQ